ncbi:3-dehydroquinate synthase [Sphingosinicella ginsenosidimutans]|uniref:3-dehydroquinate synthase n=1 Tax=Allosphingosinicella ginsenosidimutans TaxID=1176539 RepID=A0A5C6TQR3_9SPHN|nr:3-dehydroquinate synthase [Sphingosinicella ginsenosidimutans]TXC62520.1 3-dehydroquinate synthase [Sphingosinicella ginsenosidimutans]
MSIVRVELGPRAYDVRIEAGLIGRAAQHLAPLAPNGRAFVVTDQNVAAAQGARLTQGLSGLATETVTIPAGEASKSWEMLAFVTDRLLALGIERGEPIIAFGGGVVGDLAGFAAAILQRGTPYVQVPTSLLAMVDSSVGGKTAIDVSAGKNLIGAFHQPRLVLIDPEALATLAARQMRAGYAEIVKAALIGDPAFFDWLEANGASVLAGAPDALAHAIAASVAFKAAIVAEDERETSGRRALLNLGHTFAHAIEAEAGFSDDVLHGEAVAAGLALAFDLSVRRGLCAPEDAARVGRHLRATGLPASLADLGIAATGASLAGRMASDKKKAGGRVAFILARGIGRAFVDRDVELEAVAKFLDSAAAGALHPARGCDRQDQ